MTFILILLSALWGISIFLKINKEDSSSTIQYDGQEKKISKERLDTVLQYFSHRENKSNIIKNSNYVWLDAFDRRGNGRIWWRSAEKFFVVFIHRYHHRNLFFDLYCQPVYAVVGREVRTSAWKFSSGYSDSDSYSTSESEADIPIFFPTPFEELSSVQYYSLDEQLTELTAALKQQFQRHCFIQIRQQETQPMLVPFVEPVTTFTYNRSMLEFYIKRQLEKQHALPASEVDALLEQQETALLQAVAPHRAARRRRIL